jgi:calnexin
VGFELWSMSPLLLFDNVVVTDDLAIAQRYAQETFALKRAKILRDSVSTFSSQFRCRNVVQN